MHADFPLPDVSWPPLIPFWQAAAEGRLVIPACRSCGRFDWYPTSTCAECGGSERDWLPMSGNGTLFSWAVVYHAWVPQLRSFQPYATGLVALQEDPHVRVATMLVDVDVLQLVPDMPVEAVFRPLSFPPSEASVMAPFFRPIPRYG